MSTVYIVSDRGKLHKKGDTIQMVAGDGTVSTIFPFKTDQLIIMGSAEITGSALNLLMRHNIDTVFLGKNGRFNGKLAFQEGKNVFLRQKQFRQLENMDFRIHFAKSIARAKMKNQLTFMQRIKRRRDIEKNVAKAVESIKRCIKNLQETDDIDIIRGLEGSAARNYFSVFRYNIIQDWAVFNGRSMHPPEDNVNAVLSFLYTMVFFRVDAALESSGLDSYVGYFHSLNYGKRSLAFDLMEEYRTPVADTLCCSLFNLGILEEDDFEEVVFSPESADYPLQTDIAEQDDAEHAVIQEKKGVLLTKPALRKVITQLEKRLDAGIFYQPLQKSITYKRLIHEQINHFKRVLNGEETEYKPLTVK